jgi:hypothetical protein
VKRTAWRKQEDRTARDFGGRRQPGSGSRWSNKGDVRTPTLLIENKWTGSKSITLKALDLEKICDEAVAEGRTPAFGIELRGREYVLFTKDDVLEHFVA